MVNKDGSRSECARFLYNAFVQRHRSMRINFFIEFQAEGLQLCNVVQISADTIARYNQSNDDVARRSRGLSWST